MRVLPEDIFEVWLCPQCLVWNRMDYVEHEHCCNCRRKRAGDEQASHMKASDYINQVRYFNGLDIWGPLNGGEQ